MNFGQAIEEMKAGQKVAREGWNGRGMFIYYVKPGSYPAVSDCIKGIYEGDMIPYQDYIAMKNAQNKVVPWFASQSDILATDWVRA